MAPRTGPHPAGTPCVLRAAAVVRLESALAHGRLSWARRRRRGRPVAVLTVGKSAAERCGSPGELKAWARRTRLEEGVRNPFKEGQTGPRRAAILSQGPRPLLLACRPQFDRGLQLTICSPRPAAVALCAPRTVLFAHMVWITLGMIDPLTGTARTRIRREGVYRPVGSGTGDLGQVWTRAIADLSGAATGAPGRPSPPSSGRSCGSPAHSASSTAPRCSPRRASSRRTRSRRILRVPSARL